MDTQVRPIKLSPDPLRSLDGGLGLYHPRSVHFSEMLGSWRCAHPCLDPEESKWHPFLGLGSHHLPLIESRLHQSKTQHNMMHLQSRSVIKNRTERRMPPPCLVAMMRHRVCGRLQCPEAVASACRAALLAVVCEVAAAACVPPARNHAHLPQLDVVMLCAPAAACGLAAARLVVFLVSADGGFTFSSCLAVC